MADDARALGRDSEWFWTVLVNSFCTRGGSSNLQRKRSKYGSTLRWAVVAAMEPVQRTVLFEDLPNPRFQKRITAALHLAFSRIDKAGGPETLAGEYGALGTGTQRMKFLRGFREIGEKFSRNIPMDIYDETMIDRVALDHRLHKILDHVSGSPRRSPYTRREEYLREVQSEAGLPNMWYLDRLLYSQSGRFYAELGVVDTARKRGGCDA